MFAGSISTRTEQFALAPRISVRQALTDTLALKALKALKGGVGRYVQEPEFWETDDDMGNPSSV